MGGGGPLGGPLGWPLGWPLGEQPVLLQEARPAEAGIALPTVGVQDPEGCPPARWASPVAGDDHLRSLADDVPAEPDPRSTGELEPDAGRLADGSRQPPTRRGARRLEHDEADPGTARERGQPPESIGESRSRRSILRASLARGPARSSLQAGRQVDDQQVDRPAGQQRAGDRQALLGIGRGQDDQPLRLDPSRHGLDRIEGSRQVQPGDDRAGRLGLGREPQRQRRPPARHVAPQRQAHAPRQPAGSEDGIELGEPGRQDPVGIELPVRGAAWLRVLGLLDRDRCQRPDDLTHEPGRGRSPARSKGRQGRAQVRRGSCHPRQYRTSVRMNQGPARAAFRAARAAVPEPWETRARLRHRVGM